MVWPTTSRQSRGYGREHERIRRQLMADPDLLWCQDCLKEGHHVVGTICDHIVNQAAGGVTSKTNSQMLCKRHSDEKTTREAGHVPRPAVGVDGWPAGTRGHASPPGGRGSKHEGGAWQDRHRTFRPINRNIRGIGV